MIPSTKCSVILGTSSMGEGQNKESVKTTGLLKTHGMSEHGWVTVQKLIMWLKKWETNGPLKMLD